MRSPSRYPSAAIVLMLMICWLIGVLFLWSGALVSMGRAIVLMLLLSCVIGALSWVFLYATRRSGVHRLSQTQTWPRK